MVAAGLPLRHTGRRLQFGKPIAGFQRVQELLARMRETVGWAREVLGGDGVLLEHHVGRAVTGESASVRAALPTYSSADVTVRAADPGRTVCR